MRHVALLRWSATLAGLAFGATVHAAGPGVTNTEIRLGQTAPKAETRELIEGLSPCSGLRLTIVSQMGIYSPYAVIGGGCHAVPI